MMEAEIISETLDYNAILIHWIVQEDFSAFSCHESFNCTYRGLIDNKKFYVSRLNETKFL
jgi:hypothetical protein